MRRLTGMYEQRWRTGGCQGGRDLARDMTRLSHAGDDHSTAASQQQRSGAGKFIVLAIGEAVFQRQNGIGFDLQRVPGQLQRT